MQYSENVYVLKLKIMPNYHVFPYPTKCATSNFSRGVFCLPFGQDCTTQDDDILNEDKPWNLRLCQSDVPYCTPVAAGDNISFQTRFPGDPDAPDSSGVGVNIQNPDGSVISSDRANIVGEECAGFNGDNVYQSFQLDTNFIATQADTFKVGFSEGGESVSSESFCFTDDCSENTVLLESEFENRNDCYGNTYGECGYSNSLRVYAEIMDRGGSINKTYVGKKARKTEINIPYEIRLTKPVPPHIKDRILKQILAGDVVKVDGQEIMVDSFTINNFIQKGNMFLFSIPFTWTCKSAALAC